MPPGTYSELANWDGSYSKRVKHQNSSHHRNSLSTSAHQVAPGSTVPDDLPPSKPLKTTSDNAIPLSADLYSSTMHSLPIPNMVRSPTLINEMQMQNSGFSQSYSLKLLKKQTHWGHIEFLPQARRYFFFPVILRIVLISSKQPVILPSPHDMASLHDKELPFSSIGSKVTSRPVGDPFAPQPRLDGNLTIETTAEEIRQNILSKSDKVSLLTSLSETSSRDAEGEDETDEMCVDLILVSILLWLSES
jgi:hypothetical protein